MKIISITSAWIFLLCQMANGQDSKGPLNKENSSIHKYAFITVEGRGFGKKLKVEVDLGDTPDQVKEGAEYSEALTNKKSYAAILNHMSESGFELVESRDYSFAFQGTGGTYGIIFIMRKKKT